MHIAVLAGDGIGQEIMVEALRVLEALELPDLRMDHADVGGVAYKTVSYTHLTLPTIYSV